MGSAHMMYDTGIRISHGMSHMSYGLSPYDICSIPCDIRTAIDFELHMYLRGIRISHGMYHTSYGLSPYDICDIPCD